MWETIQYERRGTSWWNDRAAIRNQLKWNYIHLMAWKDSWRIVHVSRGPCRPESSAISHCTLSAVGLYMNHHLLQQKLLWWWFRGKVIYGNNNKSLGGRLIPHPCSRITAGSSLVDNTGRPCSGYTADHRMCELRESVTVCAKLHKRNPDKPHHGGRCRHEVPLSAEELSALTDVGRQLFLRVGPW